MAARAVRLRRPVASPRRLDEAHARVLCGEPPPAASAASCAISPRPSPRSMATTRPRAALLDAIARRFAVRALVVVRVRRRPRDGAASSSPRRTRSTPRRTLPTSRTPRRARVASWSGTTRSLRIGSFGGLARARVAAPGTPKRPLERARPRDAARRQSVEKPPAALAALLRIRVVLGRAGGGRPRRGGGLPRDAGQQPFHDPS